MRIGDALERLLTRLVALALRALGRSWRVELRGRNPLEEHPDGPILTAVWHRNLLMGAYVFRDRDVHVPISLSRDGRRIAAVARHLGFADPPRGSSSRGSFSLVKEMVRRLRAGAIMTVLTDGPKGPARVSKGGVMQVARMTGLPVVPIAFAARPCLRFGSWDRMILPLPGARVVCWFGERLDPASLDPESFDVRAHLALDAILDPLTDRLDAELGLDRETRAPTSDRAEEPR
jgi:lysophospholipid acyltransferase (LPLAT)-like uncharacterized protein